MSYGTDLLDQHKKRVMRGGKDLWKQFCGLKEGDIISGELAMKFSDAYGIRASDLIFFLDSRGASIEMESFYKGLCEKESGGRKMRLCCE